MGRAPSPLPALPRAGHCAAPTDLGAAACCSRSLPPPPPPPGLMRRPRCARGRAAGEEPPPPLLVLLLPVEPSGPRGGGDGAAALGGGEEGRGGEGRGERPGEAGGAAGGRAGPAGAPSLADSLTLSPSPAPPSWEQRGYRRGASSEGSRRAGVDRKEDPLRPGVQRGRGGGSERADEAAAPRYPPRETIEFPGRFLPAFFSGGARRKGAEAAPARRRA